MKKLIALFAILALSFLPVVSASGTYDSECSPNGCSQGTMVRALYNHQVAINDVITNVLSADLDTELAADHDADNDEFALAVLELTELKADHDADNDDQDINVTDLNLIKAAGIIQANGALLADPNIAIGSDTQKAKTQNLISYTVAGVYYSKAATDDVCDAEAVTDLATPGFYQKLLFSIGAAGTCTVTAGTPGASQGAVAWPATPASEIVIGGLTIGDGTNHSFTADALTGDGGAFVKPGVITQVAAALTTATANAGDLAAANPTGFAADLTETVATGTVAGATSYGTGTDADPIVRITD